MKMKIAILGAPGVGKTALAHELAPLLERWNNERWYVLDDYVQELRNTTRLEYGGFGDFVDDLQVVFKRREWELAHEGQRNTIMVGTVLDSAIHNFIRVEEEAKTRRDIGIINERLRAIAATFGLLYTDSWDYDYAFLLRSSDDFGKGLEDLISTYRAPVLSFNPEVPDDEKAQTAFEAIRAFEEDESSEADERRVRRSSLPGETDRDSSESVPDVSEPRGTSDDA